MVLTDPVLRPATMAVFAFAIASVPIVLHEPHTTVPAGKTTPADVVAHWRFQRGTPGWTAHSLHLILDSSGNDRHGHAFGEPKYRSVDLPSTNLALTFDGGDDRVFVPDHKSFHLTKSLTLEAYMQVDRYPETAAILGYIVFRGDNRAGLDPWFLGIETAGTLAFLVADGMGEQSVVRSTKPIPLGALLHVAGTLDHETGKQQLFINGKLVASRKTGVRACGQLGGTGPGVGIGCTQSPSNQGFCGTIDEVRVSATALDPDQFLKPAAGGR